MHVIEESLGVNCEYCHVANDFPKDDKEPKETARKMIRMVMDLNKNSFSGRSAWIAADPTKAKYIDRFITPISKKGLRRTPLSVKRRTVGNLWVM